jgi:hypothetical protein
MVAGMVLKIVPRVKKQKGARLVGLAPVKEG